ELSVGQHVINRKIYLTETTPPRLSPVGRHYAIKQCAIEEQGDALSVAEVCKGKGKSFNS
ncbi:MAG TPA: hypothetical protein PKW37_00745, partial [Salinivirgaceae bacterium]|nr:hypothetical protein [Salinivirgaceae bacterium]